MPNAQQPLSSNPALIGTACCCHVPLPASYGWQGGAIALLVEGFALSCQDEGSSRDYYLLDLSGVLSCLGESPLYVDGYVLTVRPSLLAAELLDSAPATSTGEPLVRSSTEHTISGRLGFHGQAPGTSAGAYSTPNGQPLCLPGAVVHNEALSLGAQNAQWTYAFKPGSPLLSTPFEHREQALFCVDRDVERSTSLRFGFLLEIHVSLHVSPPTAAATAADAAHFEEFRRRLVLPAGATFKPNEAKSGAKSGTISLRLPEVSISQPPLAF